MNAMQISALIVVIIAIIIDPIIIIRLRKKTHTFKQIILDTAFNHALLFSIAASVFTSRIIQAILLLISAMFFAIVWIKLVKEQNIK